MFFIILAFIGSSQGLNPLILSDCQLPNAQAGRTLMPLHAGVPAVQHVAASGREGGGGGAYGAGPTFLSKFLRQQDVEAMAGVYRSALVAALSFFELCPLVRFCSRRKHWCSCRHLAFSSPRLAWQGEQRDRDVGTCLCPL